MSAVGNYNIITQHETIPAGTSRVVTVTVPSPQRALSASIEYLASMPSTGWWFPKNGGTEVEFHVKANTTADGEANLYVIVAEMGE